MYEQITLFPSEKNNSLEVVEMKFLDKRYTCVEELFQGFDHLYAITFSYGLKFIEKVIDNFETAEIILGCEAMVKYDMKLIMSFQTKTLQEIPKYKKLIHRVEDGSLQFHVAKEILSHQKLFILTSNTGKSRIIWGSANFSEPSFSGRQRENIGCFENDDLALNSYMDEFETLKEFSTNKIVKDALYAVSTADELDVEQIPILKEAKVNKAGIILDNDVEDCASIEYFYDIQSLSKKYAKVIPKFDVEKGKIMITPTKVNELFRNFKKLKENEKRKQEKYPQFQINLYEGTFTLDGEKIDFNVSTEAVKQDLLHVNEYFDGFNDFIGNVEQMKSVYFRFMNYMFLSPFIARLRYEAYRTDFSTTFFPLYAILNGPKSAGKTALIETIQSIMFGKTMNTLHQSVFTRTSIFGLFHESTGVPIHINDISRERFNKYCSEIVKDDNELLYEKMVNYPVVVLTSNEVESLKPEFAKRVYYASVDAQLSHVTASTRHKKMAELRRNISTAFYHEYLQRMYYKVLDLIDEMDHFEFNESNEDWTPDIFLISSRTICEIFKDCGLDVPEYISEVRYSDYFGFSSLAEKYKEKFLFEWQHNSKVFNVLRKQNILEYDGCERQYEADRICDALPEILRAKHAGTKVVMQLDEAEKFFGIRFKKKWF